LVSGKNILLFFLIFLLLAQVLNFIQFINKTNTELAQFIEAVQYRDFSLQFSEKNAPVSVRQLRRAFNQINTTFKQLSSEKEEQYQYLQSILELVDTGILSFNHAGDVGWMNESFKKMLNIPYIKNIGGIEKRDPAVYEAIVRLNSGDHQLVKIHDKVVLLAKTTFQSHNQTTHLIAFQNVNSAIEDTESQAYQKLLRVMTHEIMNSVAPIASLAETMETRMRNNLQKLPHQPSLADLQQTQQMAEDVLEGMSVIKKRSENLLKFADTYRQLAKVSITSFSTIQVCDLFETVEILLENKLEQNHIELDVILKDFSMTLEGDIALIEQVLINLLINAIDAVKEVENPLIKLSAYKNQDEKVVIDITDNGTGMSEDMIEKIFIPFFTSKSHGSGIGLSLSKQIMGLHKGSITVQSKEGIGSIFRLTFP
jgi:signal transduction histidine kinase